jgi:putative DNA primase/helicase
MDNQNASAPISVGDVPPEAMAEASPAPFEQVTRASAQLATMAPVDYDRARKSEAAALGIRLVTLDAEVAKRRAEIESHCDQAGALGLRTIEPWPEAVDGEELLNDLTATIARYIALSEEQAAAVALWCAHAHAFDSITITPRLAITSAVRRCGKTTLLAIVEGLTPQALKVDNISAASLYRVIDAVRPTLLIDEADTFLPRNETLRGIINSGHLKSGKVIRVVGDDFRPKAFVTSCPTAIAAIGALPATIRDRSVEIRLQRRKREEAIERFRADRIFVLLRLASRLARWAIDHGAAVARRDPVIPDALNDRAADNWRALLAIADEIGGVWPDRAGVAAIALSAEAEAQSEHIGDQLLSDLREALATVTPAKNISSEGLTDMLNTMPDSPWSTFIRGGRLRPVGLAKLLRPYGLAPRTVRNGTLTAKGYDVAAFTEVFERYLPDVADVTPSHSDKAAR